MRPLLSSLFILILFSFLPGCNGKAEDEFLIEGDLRNYPSQRLLLERLDGDRLVFLDSCHTDAEGKFSFRGKAGETDLVQIRTMKNKTIFTLPGNAHLNIRADHDSLPIAEITGDARNEQLGKFRQRQVELFQAYIASYQIMRNYNREKNLEAWRKAEKTTDTYLMQYKDFLRTFTDTVQIPILRGIATLSYGGMEDFYRMQKMAVVMEQELPGHHIPATLRARSQKELKRFFAVETPNFKSLTDKGDSLALADTRGKVVIFYAWASYCEFSRRENARLREFFRKNDNPDLILVDYSFDDDKEAWLKALAEDSLPSAYHLISPSGWNNPAVRDLAITALPFTYLFDAKGIIRTANLFTQDLIEDGDSLVNRYKHKDRSQ